MSWSHWFTCTWHACWRRRFHPSCRPRGRPSQTSLCPSHPLSTLSLSQFLSFSLLCQPYHIGYKKAPRLTIFHHISPSSDSWQMQNIFLAHLGKCSVSFLVVEDRGKLESCTTCRACRGVRGRRGHLGFTTRESLRLKTLAVWASLELPQWSNCLLKLFPWVSFNFLSFQSGFKCLWVRLRGLQQLLRCSRDLINSSVNTEPRATLDSSSELTCASARWQISLQE